MKGDVRHMWTTSWASFAQAEVIKAQNMHTVQIWTRAQSKESIGNKGEGSNLNMCKLKV